MFRSFCLVELVHTIKDVAVHRYQPFKHLDLGAEGRALKPMAAILLRRS